jgi:CheY-like chemotaxis protein
MAMRSVLIVEDEFIIAYAMGTVLEGAGFEVAGLAATFERAAEIAEAKRPDLAVIDFRLQGDKDGVAVARHVRQLGTKVIYVTSNDGSVRRADPDAVIVPKPWTPDELLRAVARVMEKTPSP